VFEGHSKRKAALAGSFDRPACLPYTIANIHFKNPHNISACFLLSRRQETAKKKRYSLYALRINQRHTVVSITFEFNLNFPILPHHIIIKSHALHTFQPSYRTMVLDSTQLLTDMNTRIFFLIFMDPCIAV
jgi:hypothetical protein